MSAESPPMTGRIEFPSAETPNGNVSLLTAEQVAELLSVPKTWVYAEARASRIPFVKLGRYYRFSRPSIEAFIAGLERGPTVYRKYGVPRNRPGGSSHD